MASNLPSILVVEDDPRIRRFLRVSLEGKGYAYLEAEKGKEALEVIAAQKPDVIILDLGLPDIDGHEFLKNLREWSEVPVVVLTARDQDQDKIEALDHGADDYLTKPFSVGELLARVRVALRHASRFATEQGPVFRNGSLKIDSVKRQIFVGGVEVHLKPLEYKILLYLAKHADRVVTQQQLIREVWGATPTDQANHLRVQIHQLRHKIEENPARPKWLVSEPGVGYCFRLEEA